MKYIFILTISGLSLYGCKGSNGSKGVQGTQGPGTVVFNSLSATCTALNGNITVPTIVPAALAAANIISLVCSETLNEVTPWANYDLFQCQANSYATSIQSEAASTLFLWPADGNTFNTPFTTNFSQVTVGTPFACAAGCTATYSNGTQSYIMLLGQGTCS